MDDGTFTNSTQCTQRSESVHDGSAINISTPYSATERNGPNLIMSLLVSFARPQTFNKQLSLQCSYVYEHFIEIILDGCQLI